METMRVFGAIFRWLSYIVFVALDILFLTPASFRVSPVGDSWLYIACKYVMSVVFAVVAFNVIAPLFFLLFMILYYIYSSGDIKKGNVDHPNFKELPIYLLDEIPTNTVNALVLHFASLMLGCLLLWIYTKLTT